MSTPNLLASTLDPPTAGLRAEERHAARGVQQFDGLRQACVAGRRPPPRTYPRCVAATVDPEKRLRLFVEKFDAAVSRRAIREGTIQAGWTLQASDESSELTTDLGDDDDVRSLMIDFRSFVSPKEPAFANRVFNELERRLSDDTLKEHARSNRVHWDRAKAGGGQVVNNGVIYTAERAFDLRINGEIFHSDEAKRAEWDALGPWIQAMLRTMVNGFIIDGLYALHPTRNLVNQALKEGLLSF